MKRSVKQAIKVLTLSGVVGALGGLLSPPRTKDAKSVSLLPEPLMEEDPAGVDNKEVDLGPPEELEVPIANEASEDDRVQEKPKKRQSAPSKPKTAAAKPKTTAAAAKPKPSSSVRIPKSPKPRTGQPKDQSGGSEK